MERKYIKLIVVIVLTFTAGIFAGYFLSPAGDLDDINGDPVKAVRALNQAYYQGKYEQAQSYATGGYFAELAGKKDANGEKLNGIDINKVIESGSYAVIKATINTIKDGSDNTRWVKYFLINDNGWKVHSCVQEMPEVAGKTQKISDRDVQTAAGLVKKYLTALQTHVDYKTADIFAGPLKDSMEQARPNMVNDPGTEQIKPDSVKLTPFMAAGKYLVCGVNYKYGGGDVSVIGTFYKTPSGLRIVEFVRK